MESQLLIKVGQRVRELRKQQGFSQEQLAEMAGLHFTFISAIERADKNLTMTSLSKIADALKTPVYQLVMDPDDIQKLIMTDQELTKKISALINKMNTNDLNKVYLFLTEIMDAGK